MLKKDLDLIIHGSCDGYDLCACGIFEKVDSSVVDYGGEVVVDDFQKVTDQTRFIWITYVVCQSRYLLHASLLHKQS